MLDQIAHLSPEKRRLLELMLKEQGVDISRSLIVPQKRDTNRFTVSFAQQRLWFLDQLEPGSPLYNIPAAVRLTGRLDVAALQQCLHELVRRHESLRTTFAAADGQPLQVITPVAALGDAPLPFLVNDLRALPASQREAEARRLATEMAQQPFDLAHGPLLRAALLQLDEDEHVALFAMHHIVSDGWSMGVLIREIAALYAAAVAGRPSPLLPLSIQYADFAAWQRQWLQGAELERQLSYWKRQLGGQGGITPPLPLPTDRPRPSIQSFRGTRHYFSLPKQLSEQLKALSQREGATLFMTLLAAFQTLLYRYSGQDDINVGSPIANRTRAEIEPLIGCFINTLVLRGDLSGDPSFRELLRRVRETALGAFAHQDLPFEMIVEALQPERDLSRTPLFQVMFILQNAPVGRFDMPGLTLSAVEAESGVATFDLTLAVSEGAEELQGALEYNTDLFDAATIARMLGHFETLLAAIAIDPALPVSALPLLTEAERRQLLVDWNETAAAHPLDRCIHQLFEDQAAHTPDALALSFEHQRLSYAELNGRANQLARHLQSLGVGPETLVGVCAERSLELIVAVLAVLKAGGAYLPLDPAYPAERLQYMLADAQVAVLLTSREIRDWRLEIERVEQSPISNLQSPTVVYLDTDWKDIAQQPATNLDSVVTPDNLAYVIYTSGSTGQSKGVMVTHRSLANAYLAWEQAYKLRTDTHVHLQMASFSFDVFTGDLVRALCSGGTLVLCPRELLLAPEQLYDLMRRESVDCAEFVPVVLRTLIQHLEARGRRLDFMRLLVCGSDAWHAGEYQLFRRYCGPHTRLVNSFGLTEATIDSTYFEAAGNDAAEAQLANGRLPIGRPFANTQIYILDANRRLVPAGVPGELYIGGAGVARGYLNRPELTDERFVPNPFAQERVEIRDWRLAGADATISNLQSPISSRLYRTGDLARYLPDGNVEFLGRADQQVKVRGYRIEPGEIEALLGRHPSVREVAVAVREVAPGDTRLVAYVVPRDWRLEIGDSASDNLQSPISNLPQELRAFLKERLPDYMVPSAFVVLEALPLTPNGKLDRRALPEPDWSLRTLAEDYVAPRTPVEEVLAGIWAQVLGVAQVGAHDHFFELGGHSLLATQLMSRLRDSLQVEIPLRSIFEAPTVAALAEHVEIAQRSAAGVQAPSIRPAPRDGALPLSFSQQRLWFLDQLEPGSPLYNIPDAVRLTGRLDLDALGRCLDEIVRRHEALRTTFVTVDGRARQVIAPMGAVAVPLPTLDLRHVPADQREAEVLRLATQEAQRPFDLARGPLLRATLLQLGEDEHVALFTTHHIISDGWSGAVLTREVAQLYAAFASGQPSPLAPLPIQYADYAAWQRGWLQGQVLEAQLSYWKRQLGGAGGRGGPPPLDLPTDRPRPAVQTFRGAHQPFTLPQQLSDRIKSFSRKEGATLFMTLLAAFQTLLYRYSGQDDISVGTPIAGRNRAEIEPLIGCFINTLVLRSGLAGDMTFRALLRQVRETALGAYAHQDLPFEMIVDVLQPERNLSRTPLFQVMFILQNAPMGAIQLPGLTLGALEIENGISTFDVTLTMEEGPGGLGGSFEYNTDLFDAATITRMIGHFQQLLEALATNPDCRISALPLLTVHERRQVLVEWNDTAAPFPLDRCIHQLFEAQAARTPNAVALMFDHREPEQRTKNKEPRTDGDATRNTQHATRNSFLNSQFSYVTYRELNQRANQLAHFLRARGVGPETLVGLCAERSPELIVGLLGILKAGAAYLPLDPAYPAERLRFMIEDAQVSVLLTSREIRDWRLESERDEQSPISNLQSLRVVYLDADWETIARQPATNPDSGVTPDNLAYVIYTSGSTGKPKGVQVTHRALVNYTSAAADTFALQPHDRVLQFASISFDTAAEEIFPTLVSGAALVLRTDAMLSDAPAFLEQCRALDISVLDLPTAYWHQLTAELVEQRLPLPDALRLVIIGGERALVERVEAWRRQVGTRVRLLNTYGPTEATVVATIWEASGSAMLREVPIGTPVRNVQTYILDRAGNPVPLGVPGELHIGGAGLARGYLGRPDLTAERFVPDPFAQERVEIGDWRLSGAQSPISNLQSPISDRLYKTGDLARYLPDGNIEYLGRIDQQVKVRGFRIELGEIEAALRQHKQVREAVVLAREDAPGVKRLVAYIMPGDWRLEIGDSSGDNLQSPISNLSGELRAFLKDRLPDYMIPAAFVPLESLPLTPSGKVDRKALPAPDQARSEPDAAYVAPSSSVEQTLARIWAQVLGVAHVGVNDNFFALGGDSILSIQVISRANQAGLRLTPKHLFQAATVAELAKLVGTSGATQAEQGLVVGAVPFTPIQRWFFEQEFAEPQHWNQSLLFAVSRPLELELLEQTITRLLSQHDALRLRFDRAGGQWTQDNAGMPGDGPVSWFDLSGLAEPEQRPMIESTAAALQASLDLTNGPLLRVAYFDLGLGRPGRLLLVIHHLAVDGVSWRILLEDLQAVYQQLRLDAASGVVRDAVGAVREPPLPSGEPTLPPKTTSFRAWALRLAEYARSDAVRAELDYWLAASGGRVARLPVDEQGGANTEGSARVVTVELNAEETRALLQDVPATYHTEINDVLMTALAQACAGWTGTRAVLIELEGHGREDLFEDIDISRTVGWFTTVFPVRLELPDRGGPGESLKAVKEQLRRMPNRGIGYGLLRYLADDATIERLRALPPAEISFNYLGQTAQALQEGASFTPAPEDGGPSYSPLATRSCLLDINGAIVGGRLQMHWTYSENIHRRATVERVAQEFIAALRALIAHCQSPNAGGYTPSDFSLAKLDQRKLDKVLAKFTKKERSAR